VDLFFQDCRESGFKDVPYHYLETVDGDHGRIETRRYWATSFIDWLPDKALWKNLRTIVMVERERVDKKITVERSYYISSLEDKVEELAHAIRGHWGIENSLHWVLDIAFREDESRIRKDYAPENFAILRHMALNLLRKETSSKSIKRKRLRAGWDNEYLIRILTA
jgi:predicted transposase YbfD/YdcC